MKKLFFLLFTYIPVFLLGQDNQFLSFGKVTDAVTNLPLAGASVFCQNTTLGTITNSEGMYNLKLPNGGYDLIISYTGYETEVVRINNNNASNLAVALKQKDKSLQEVAVIGSSEVANGLLKYGPFFMDNFMGNTTSAAQCKIENPEALQFYFSKKRNRLKVKAKEDLIIVNNALGYKIKFQLDSFAYEYTTDISMYTGFPFFETLTGTDEQQKIWQQNRDKAYKGSRLHFVRSWYNKTIEGEGFEVEKVNAVVANKLITTTIENLYDSLLYRQLDNKEVEINYNGKLRVSYKNALPNAKYLSDTKQPENLQLRVSMLDINEGFIIQPNGFFYDQNDITNSGYWSWEKLAEALPYDYTPQ